MAGLWLLQFSYKSTYMLSCIFFSLLLLWTKPTNWTSICKQYCLRLTVSERVCEVIKPIIQGNQHNLEYIHLTGDTHRYITYVYILQTHAFAVFITINCPTSSTWPVWHLVGYKNLMIFIYECVTFCNFFHSLQFFSCFRLLMWFLLSG